MPDNHGTQTITADERQTGNIVDPEAPVSQSKQKPGKQPTSRRRRVLVIAVAVMAAIAGGYFAWNGFRYEDTDDAQVDGHVMPLSARISGQIKQVHVIEGQVVHAGDVLVTIDPQDYKIAAAQAQANLADTFATAASSHYNVPITSVTVQSNLDSAKTGLVNAEAALRAAEQNYESAKAALVQAEANAARSDADLHRYKQLVAKEDISRQQYDQAVATATANRAAVDSAQAGVHAAEESVQEATRILKPPSGPPSSRGGPECSTPRLTPRPLQAKPAQR
jgi:membrane fusion protein, multidrug efflux system